MNIQSARNVSEFVHVLARDDKDRPTRLLVPGHGGKRYEVKLKRNDSLQANCELLSKRGMYFMACKGNQHSVCYHVLAACIATASEQGKELSWCETEQDAKRLANLSGKVFTVKSAQSGKLAYGVVKSIEPDEPALAPAGLSKAELIKLAVELAGDKQQWYSGETMYIAEDAFLANDDGWVRLYYSDKGQKRYPIPVRLGIIFWLDPGNIEAGWQRYTVKQARDELFD